MSDKVKEFLDRIGPRELTPAEARELHILRLKEGATRNSGVAEALSSRKTGGDDVKKSV